MSIEDKIKELKRIIDESNNIVFFGGAGVSTESNIPDFRSEEGLYKAKSKYNYSPEYMLSHTFFMKNTDIFYSYYKENLIYLDAKPNKAHMALSELEKKGKLKAVITQNIDNLHQEAGSEKVYELHGSVHRNNCMKCGKFFDLNYVIDEENCKDNVPVCDACGGIVKPDVVLFEESLDDDTVRGAIQSIMEADTLIIGGTSLAVYPAAGLIEYFRGKNLILINRDSTPYDSRASLVINERIGEVLGKII